MPRPGLPHAVVVLALTLGGVGAGFSASTPSTSASPVASSAAPSAVSAPDRRPNVVLVTTDDQTTYDLRWMPLTRQALGGSGRTFTRAISPHPLCCPARAELLTGQYAQNNKVQHNIGKYGGYRRFREQSTVATWLWSSGYRTAFHGKYLNQYSSRDVRQPGWEIWDPLVGGIYDYRNFTLYNNNMARAAKYQNSYVTDVLARRTESTVRKFARGRAPFFIWTSHVAPHAASAERNNGDEMQFDRPVPAQRHASLFAKTTPPSLSKPNFNEADMSDQPRQMRTRHKRPKNKVKTWFRARIRSLQAVDESVSSLVRTLDQVGELDNTWIIFTSDNGYALGEHRYFGKNFLNEEITGVPMLVSGPGVANGSKSSTPVSLVDIPVTIADIANVRPKLAVDGRSFLGVLKSGRASGWRDTQLIQTGSSRVRGKHPGWAFRGVRTARYVYAKDMQTGAKVLYDHKFDKYEVRNVANHRRYARVVRELERRAQLLRSCRGAGCNRRFGPPPGPLKR